jgi:hypothetical protein
MYNKTTSGRFVEQKLVLNSNFRCDQIHAFNWYDFGHTFVLLKSNLGVQQTQLWGPFDEQISCLARALGVTKLTNVRDMISVTFCGT